MKTPQEKINEMKAMKMTPFEKASIRLNLVEMMEKSPAQSPTPSKSIKSPYSAPNRFFPSFAKGLAFALVFLLVGGGSLAFASQQALPGDALYPIKINLTEKVVGAITAKTPEQKIAYQKSLVERRMTEMETLANRGNLSVARQQIAEKAFVSNTNDIATGDILPTIEIHKKALADIIAKHPENAGAENLMSNIDSAKANIARRTGVNDPTIVNVVPIALPPMSTRKEAGKSITPSKPSLGQTDDKKDSASAGTAPTHIDVNANATQSF